MIVIFEFRARNIMKLKESYDRQVCYIREKTSFGEQHFLNRQLLLTFLQMQSAKSKSAKMLRKLTSPQHKHTDHFADISNVRLFQEPRRSSKQLGKHLTRDHSKKAHNSKNYLFNKTALGTPYDKSAILSYISTPNEKSFNAEKLKMIRGDQAGQSLKIRQQFQSTEDQNFGEDLFKINLALPDRKPISKYFAPSHKLGSIHSDFQKHIQDFIEKSKISYYGTIGFEAQPFSYYLSQLINQKGETTLKTLMDSSLKEMTIVPALLKKPISYDSLEFSDFQIIKFLGSGGFSQVFLGKCKLDYQYCALKFIRKDTITTVKKAKMLENEKNILFTIKHQNLIDLLYAFQTKHYIVFGLEYCPNGNLYSYLQKVKSLSQAQARSVMIQILKGLDYLHSNNILFRDIKLENILFDSKGCIKITDFGLSKPEVDEDQITYSYCGSPEYMAPQMLTKSGHSYQVDFYALGILLYQLLFGRSPFYAPKKEDIFNAILHSEPKFPKHPDVSKEVKSLIKGLLAKNPNHRIGSLKGVKEILSHPWFRQEIEPIILPELSLYEHKHSKKKDLEEARQIFASQQSDKRFQKVFFGQNFVNRSLYEAVNAKVWRFSHEERVSKGLLVKSSTSKRK